MAKSTPPMGAPKVELTPVRESDQRISSHCCLSGTDRDSRSQDLEVEHFIATNAIEYRDFGEHGSDTRCDVHERPLRGHKISDAPPCCEAEQGESEPPSRLPCHSRGPV